MKFCAKHIAKLLKKIVAIEKIKKTPAIHLWRVNRLRRFKSIAGDCLRRNMLYANANVLCAYYAQDCAKKFNQKKGL